MRCWDVQTQVYVLHHRDDNSAAASAQGAARLVILEAWAQKCPSGQPYLSSLFLQTEVRTDSGAKQEHAATLQKLKGLVASTACTVNTSSSSVRAGSRYDKVRQSATHASAVSRI